MKTGECWSMYHKIHKLYNDGLGVSQIKSKINKSRDTIYKYLKMTEDEFTAFLKNQKSRKKKLEGKEPLIKNLLETYPEIMATQVESQLKERFGDLKVHPKTVNNFVLELRAKYKIPKPMKNRVYEAIEELDYGKQAQVDFGQKVMKIADTKKRVYFFAIVLSRSRKKYIYFQLEPFTSTSAISCFERAFSYFGGFPEEIVFDQDRVFMVDENYGDLLLTDEFSRYVGSRPFRLNPCRCFDPESKGKVENVVKYVKYNFLSCREFINLADINRQSQVWLDLTGNGKEHQSTKKIPNEEFVIEKDYLIPYNKIELPEKSKEIYNLRKDNIVIYKSNRYRTPKGTYKDKYSEVKLREEDNYLIISDIKNEELIRHIIPTTKGNIVGDKSKNRNYTKTISKLTTCILDEFNKNESIERFIEKLKSSKGKYIRDQLSLLEDVIEKYGTILTLESVQYCLDNSIISVPDLKIIIDRSIIQDGKKKLEFSINSTEHSFNKYDLSAEKRSIDEYQAII